MLIEKNALIVKSNDLIESRMHFCANEYKIITFLESRIKKEDDEFREFEVSVKELNELFDYGEKTKSLYDILKKKYAENLANKNLSILRNGGSDVSIYNFFTLVETDRGTIKFCFSPRLKEFLLGLEKNFTSYRLSNILGLKTFYAIRIYEISKQYEKLGKRVINLDELKYMLGIDTNQYIRPYDFRKKVLDKSLEEINKHSDIKLGYDFIKRGKNYEIIFTISSARTIYKSKELADIKLSIETVINAPVNAELLQKTLENYNIEKKDIQFYLSNWGAYKHIDKTNVTGFFVDLLKKKAPLPKQEKGEIPKYKKPIQTVNYEQREYTDEYYDSLYDN